LPLSDAYVAAQLELAAPVQYASALAKKQQGVSNRQLSTYTFRLRKLATWGDPTVANFFDEQRRVCRLAAVKLDSWSCTCGVAGHGLVLGWDVVCTFALADADVAAHLELAARAVLVLQVVVVLFAVLADEGCTSALADDGAQQSIVVAVVLAPVLPVGPAAAHRHWQNFRHQHCRHTLLVQLLGGAKPLFEAGFRGAKDGAASSAEARQKPEVGMHEQRNIIVEQDPMAGATRDDHPTQLQNRQEGTTWDDGGCALEV
jgi:hypothetical protein